MAFLRATAGLLLSLACLSASAGYAAAADPQFKIGATIIGDLKYQPGFTHFDYANPDAPKGGDVKLGADGTFDTFNPILQKGAPAAGVASLVFDTLLKHSDDETASLSLFAIATVLSITVRAAWGARGRLRMKACRSIEIRAVVLGS